LDLLRSHGERLFEITERNVQSEEQPPPSSLLVSGDLGWLKSRRAQASPTRAPCHVGFASFTAVPSRGSSPDDDQEQQKLSR
jgi:hypothetical protein